MFLRELGGEVLENVALSLLIARYLQRVFSDSYFASIGVICGAPESVCLRSSNFSYSVALNAAHK